MSEAGIQRTMFGSQLRAAPAFFQPVKRDLPGGLSNCRTAFVLCYHYVIIVRRSHGGRVSSNTLFVHLSSFLLIEQLNWPNSNGNWNDNERPEMA